MWNRKSLRFTLLGYRYHEDDCGHRQTAFAQGVWFCRDCGISPLADSAAPLQPSSAGAPDPLPDSAAE